MTKPWDPGMSVLERKSFFASGAPDTFLEIGNGSQVPFSRRCLMARSLVVRSGSAKGRRGLVHAHKPHGVIDQRVQLATPESPEQLGILLLEKLGRNLQQQRSG